MLYLMEPKSFEEFKAKVSMDVPESSFNDYVAARGSQDSETGPDIYSSKGGKATVSITGSLQKSTSFWSWLYGWATYDDIISSIALAEADVDVSEIVLAIDSPGGSVFGLDGVVEAVKTAKKPVSAVVDDIAASAAYWIASQADKIEALNRTSMVGSIGVATSFYVSDNVVDVASSEAPNKRPDVTTDQGVKVVQRELDAIHEIFASDVAEGRGTTVKNVNANFGKGGIVLASEAINTGMLDGFYGSTSGTGNIIPAASAEQPIGGNLMDMATLKAKHSDVYAEVMALGVNQERDRVTAHLIMAEASGAFGIATEAIKDGSELTSLLSAKYQAEQMKKQAVNDRVADDKEADPGTPDASATPADEGDQVANAVLELAGVEGELQ